MRHFYLIAVAAVAVVLSACATSQQQSNPPVLQKLQEMGIDSRTYAKIANQRVLSYDDILGLVKKQVPSPVILTYIKSTKAPYNLTNAQLNALINAGASADLMNYLGKSSGFFEASQRSQTGKSWRNDPYFNDPYYMGAAPFGYMWPAEWYDGGWIDNAF